MRVLYISFEFPYPPNHGGRVDIWNRLRAMKQLNYSIYLLTSVELVKGDIPSEQSVNEVKSQTTEMEMFRIDRKLKRIINLLKYPQLVAARLLSNNDYNKVLVKLKEFKPEIVFIDGIYAGVVGLRFANDLGIPVGLRVHNIEHKYMRGQYELCKSFKQKLSVGLALLHLKRYEINLLNTVDAFFDISQEDMLTWGSLGLKNGYWLPTVHSSFFVKKKEINYPKKTDFDICFLGNLNAPNNVDGIGWFLQDVLPIIKMSMPQVNVLIMGSRPSEIVKKLCITYGVTLVSDPVTPEVYFNCSKVLINPVRFGSGINIKSVDMLFTENKIVSTSTGIKGLPNKFRQVFSIADTAEIFAAKTLEGIQEDSVDTDLSERTELRKLFGYSSIEIVKTVLLPVKN